MRQSSPETIRLYCLLDESPMGKVSGAGSSLAVADDEVVVGCQGLLCVSGCLFPVHRPPSPFWLLSRSGAAVQERNGSARDRNATPPHHELSAVWAGYYCCATTVDNANDDTTLPVVVQSVCCC